MSGKFEFIVNPETGRKVNVNGKVGRTVLNNYINQLGGAIRAGSRIPSDQFLQSGGHNGPCAVKASSGRCAKGASWDRVNCALKNGRCVKNKSPKKAAKKAVKKMVKKGKTVHPKKLKEVGTRVSAIVDGHKKARKQSNNNMVFVGSLGDIRDHEDGPVIGWATVDGKFSGDYLPFIEDRMQKDPRTIKRKKSPAKKTTKTVAKKPRKSAKKLRKTVAKKPRKPMRASKDVKSHGRTVKTVTTKKHGKSQRLSAGEYYRNHGMDRTIGDRCNIRRDGEYKCLLKRANGTVSWAKKSKSGAGQEACGDWSSRCQEPDFA